MRGLIFSPEDLDVKKLFNRICQIENKYGIGMRISPDMAQKLSNYKAIRRLSYMDLIDIARKKNGKRRSILYIPPVVKIKKTGNRFYIDLSQI